METGRTSATGYLWRIIVRRSALSLPREGLAKLITSVEEMRSETSKLCRLSAPFSTNCGPNDPVVPHDKLITFVQDRPGHDRRYAIDAGKIERELSWQPLERFESGIRKTIE